MLALCRDLKAAQNYAGIIFTSLPANTVLFLEFSSAELRGLLDNYVAVLHGLPHCKLLISFSFSVIQYQQLAHGMVDLPSSVFCFWV